VRRPGSAQEKVRARLSHFYFNDRIETVTPGELTAAQHNGGPAPLSLNELARAALIEADVDGRSHPTD
jgi:ubiquinol-cytochrome c reductase cytochrome b subunit